MGQFLGQAAPKGTITYDPVSKLVRWSATGLPALHVYVNGTLWAETGPTGEGTVPAEWPLPLKFELMGTGAGVEGPLLATVTVNADGSSTAPPPSSPAPPSGGGAPAGGGPEGSWFEQSTNIMGADIPNLALVGAGGLLLLVAIKKRKK